MAFFIQQDTVRLAIVALGIYGHVIAYSPGEGPIPVSTISSRLQIY